MLKLKHRQYTVTGIDAWGVPMTETIWVPIVPLWLRAIRRIGRWFGYGRPRMISCIKIKED